MADLKQSKLIISSADAASAVLPSSQDSVDDTDGATEFVEFESRKASVPVGNHGERLDRTLALIVPEFSRSYLQQLIASGAVLHNGLAQIKSSTRVKAGDSLTIELKPTPQSQAFKPEAMALDVVFEDEFLLVINKPAGLVVHPAPGNWSGTLLNGLLARDAQAANLPRAGIVHRLDKDTSGLMVVARTRQTMDQLVGMIAARHVSRQYLALAHHPWKGAKTRHIDMAVGRDTKNRLRMAVVDLDKQAGKAASTDITLIDNGSANCLVRCKLHTGRTHQIRVHMAAIGHPLVSDALYGGALAAGMQRQALHACRLAFDHPATGRALAFVSNLPPDMQLAITDLALRYN
ncbi:MAG: RluA family pseudouridine synthase [Vitreoscilla sp.]|nr:RluA family pseudouridine synthase [Polaromonas sp.]